MTTIESKSSRLPDFLDEDEVYVMGAVKFYELGKLSLGKAAELAGLSIRGFLDLLAKHEIPVVKYGSEEVAEDLANA